MPGTFLSTLIHVSTDPMSVLSPSNQGTRITLEVSDDATSALKVPDDCFLILVPRKSSPTSRFNAILPDASEITLEPAEGSVWLLPPRAQLSQVGEGDAKAVRYLVPCASLIAFATQCGMVERSSLVAPQTMSDPFLQMLSRVVIPLLSTGKRSIAASAVVRYFLSSFFSHLVTTYGTSTQSGVALYAGGLAPRHKTLIESLLSSPENLLLTSDELAGQCRLSPAHFARAFRQSFGVTVHKYLVSRRLEHAKQHLAHGQLTLEEVAHKAGYADQASFTESFKRFAGSPPGRFRRRFAAALPSLHHSASS